LCGQRSLLGLICFSADLQHVGKATNAGGFKTRIRQYFHPGYGNATSIRIRGEFSVCTDFEVSWFEVPAEQAAKIETLLIASYEKAHGALPPWNKRR
jgi:hypothetical protein